MNLTAAKYVGTFGGIEVWTHPSVRTGQPFYIQHGRIQLMNSNKDHFVAVLTEAETSGLLPKGKTADILENYDFLVDAIDKRTKLVSDDRPTIPEGDSSEGETFVRGRGKAKPPADKE